MSTRSGTARIRGVYADTTTANQRFEESLAAAPMSPRPKAITRETVASSIVTTIPTRSCCRYPFTWELHQNRNTSSRSLGTSHPDESFAVPGSTRSSSLDRISAGRWLLPSPRFRHRQPLDRQKQIPRLAGSSRNLVAPGFHPAERRLACPIEDRHRPDPGSDRRLGSLPSAPNKS